MSQALAAGMTPIQDPISVEILGNRLVAISEEMSLTLIQSSYSTMIQESADASTGIFDGTGRLLAQSNTTSSLHAASLRECLRTIMDEFPPADMQAGDSYLMNDPFRGGIHTNDLAVFSPVRAGGQLYLTGAIVHVADLGGMSAGGLPAEAREVFHEGILIPPVRLRQAGTMRREIADLLALNSRTPEKVLGDTRALVAATCVGTERLEELATEWDRDLSPIWDELLRYTEARLRSEIAQLPLGEWQAQFTVDGDGVSACENTVRITLRHATPGDIEVDFTGTGPQAAGPINSAYSQSVSGAIVGIHCFLSNDIPMNEGVFRAIGTVLPLGSLVNPRKPAAVNARVVVVAAIVEGIIEIMGRLLPDRAVAPSSLHHIYTLSGRDGAWIYVDIEYGGIGGRRDRDGVNGSGPYFFGGRGGTVQLEAIEREYPVRFTRQAIVPNSGGAGRHRGGTGICRAFTALEDAEITVRADRIERPPQGAAGGRAGKPGSYMITTASGQARPLRGKQTSVAIEAGDIFTMISSGGGGFGEPFERDPAAVARDVLSGAVTADAAAEEYGVVLGGDQLGVDAPATTERRASQRAGEAA